jgi:acyl-CoA synthetase (NDP forming)
MWRKSIKCHKRNLKKSDLRKFFEPEGLAVIGSFKEGVFGGYVVIKSLLEAGYKGKIYPVNPGGYKEVLGFKVYHSPKDIPGDADLALLMINARYVPGVIKDCAAKGIKSIVLVADGFAERDAEGARLQEEVVQIAKSLGVRIIGPNTAGIANAMNGFNPCPYDAGYYRFKKGRGFHLLSNGHDQSAGLCLWTIWATASAKSAISATNAIWTSAIS